MLLNILYTILLTLNVGTKQTNFKVQKNEQRRDNQQQVGETEYNQDIYGSTMEDWRITWGAVDGNARYRYYWKSTDLTTRLSIPSTYLNVTGMFEYVEGARQENDMGLIPYSTIDDPEMNLTDTTYADLQYGLRDLPTLYIKLRINPIQGNRNVTIRPTISTPYYDEINDYQYIKILSYATTVQLENDTEMSQVFAQIKEQQTYTSNVKTKMYKYTEDYNINTPIIPNTINYMYMFIQPTILVQNYNNGKVYLNDSRVWVDLPTPTSNTHTQVTYDYSTTVLINGFNFSLGTIEVIDLGGVMFTVLGMPFTFISTAFNLTLFQGTPYQVNISMLLLAIFAVLVFVFIIKLILGAIKK